MMIAGLSNVVAARPSVAGADVAHWALAGGLRRGDVVNEHGGG